VAQKIACQTFADCFPRFRETSGRPHSTNDASVYLWAHKLRNGNTGKRLLPELLQMFKDIDSKNESPARARILKSETERLQLFSFGLNITPVRSKLHPPARVFDVHSTGTRWRHVLHLQRTFLASSKQRAARAGLASVLFTTGRMTCGQGAAARYCLLLLDFADLAAAVTT
jgi:hypothetical protein